MKRILDLIDGWTERRSRGLAPGHIEVAA